MADHLIPKFENIDASTLQDRWLLTAKMIEESLVDAGATPGEDYTRLDLYKLAQPLIIEQIKSGDLVI